MLGAIHLMQPTGTVFNIQRFSTHDGPGIRTTVFFKGCPLTCHWCANPESIARAPQLMVRDVKCAGCGACIEACPEQAIALTGEKKRRIDWEDCTQCLQCVEACLYGALTVIGEPKTPEEILEEVEKDRLFYENSGGGATISGGEPLMQPEFLKAVLLLLKQNEFHTTLDTTGFASATVLDEVLPLVDLVLLDIKHLDPDCHRQYTGVSNETVQENLNRITRQAATWFRIPLIKGINDGKAHIEKIAETARMNGVEKISLLPFHQGGHSKWGQVGLKRPEFTGKTPDEEHMQALVDVIAAMGIQADIGC